MIITLFLVSKYLDDGNATISSRMSKISLHSVAKKSARLGLMLTSTLFGVAVSFTSLCKLVLKSQNHIKDTVKGDEFYLFKFI
jgi:hypothetical protein